MPTSEPQEPRADQGGPDPFSAAAWTRRFGARRRMLLVAVTVLLMVFLAAPTTKIYLDQRAEMAALERSIAEKEATRDELKDQVALWEDPAYVKQQARDRLLMVEPGQRSYLVVGTEDLGDQAPSSSAVQEEADRPAWADALWGSVLDSAWPEQRVAPSQAENFPQLGGSGADGTQPSPEPGTGTDPASGSPTTPTN